MSRQMQIEKENSTGSLIAQVAGAAFFFYIVRSVVPSVVANLHVLGGVVENLAKGLVRLLRDHVGNFLVGFLQNFGRRALPDLLVIFVEELLPAVHHRVHVPLVKEQGVAEMRVR